MGVDDAAGLRRRPGVGGRAQARGIRHSGPMHFVGIDLAWGGRRPTGLAVLDDDGRLVHLSSAVADKDVVRAVRPWTADACVVAVDAPLVVTNPTGNRPAEAALNRDFARFDAGAHPVNTGRPGFEDSPRGARLAVTLGLGHRF